MLVLGLVISTALAKEPEKPEQSSAQEVSCGELVPGEVIVQSIGAATGAFAGLDLEGFERHSEQTWANIPCLRDPLTPLDVADVYKLRALTAFLAQDNELVLASLQSLRKLAPDYRLPSSIAPKGHPLRTAFSNAVVPEDEPMEELPIPADARLYVDGQPVLARPTQRASFLQLVNSDGSVSWSQLLNSDTPLPAYESLSDDYKERYLQGAKVIRVRERHPIELVVASSAALIGASALYGMSLGSRARFEDPTTPYEDIAGLRASTNSLQTAAVITGVAGLGLGTTAVVTW